MGETSGGTSEGLTHLHRIHEQLEAANEELAAGPGKVARRNRATAAKQAEAENQKTSITNLRKAADAKSLQLKSSEARIADLRAKLNAAASNREYDIIKTQIDADEMANSVLEDEILEMLEKVDQAETRLEEIRQELSQCEADEKQVAQAVADAQPGLQKQVDELTSAMREAESVIPASARDGYKRLVSAHGAGALASVEQESCSSCRSMLAPQERVQLNTGKIIFCRACGRLLYRPDNATDGE